MFKTQPPPLPPSNGAHPHANANGNGNGNGFAAAAKAPAGPTSQEVKAEVHRKLLETLDLAQARRMPRDVLQAECSRRVDHLLNEQRCPLSAPEKQRLLSEVM